MVNPVELFLISYSLITVQNLVAPCPTVLAYVGGPKTFGGGHCADPLR